MLQAKGGNLRYNHLPLNTFSEEWQGKSISETILILTADVGFGHRRAAQAVEAALHELYDPQFNIVIADPFDDSDVPQLLKEIEQGYDDMVVSDPGLYRFSYNVTDTPAFASFIQDVTAAAMHRAMKKLLATYQPRAVISTYPAFTEAAFQAGDALSQSAPISVIVTDLVDVHSLWFHKRADATFVPNGHVYKQALEHQLAKQHVFLSGLPVHPDFLREAGDKTTIRRALGWNTDLTTALIVGSPRSSHMLSMAKLLDRSGLPLQLVVVSGGAADTYDALRMVQWQGATHIYGKVENIAEMMHAADFIICKAGGLIVSEALACGLPLVLYEALPGQEAGNVRYIVENGAGVWAPGPVGALAAVYNWLTKDGDVLNKLRAGSAKAGRPQAAYDIAKTICEGLLVNKTDH